MLIKNIIDLLCGVALFLFGMQMMGSGLKSVAGNKLELILYRLSNTPLKGVLLGTGVTAVIQSSSATSIMVVGFVNSGMMQVKQAIGVVLGAILGTSITGWIICLSEVGGSGAGWISLFSTATLTGVIAVVGIILRMFCKKQMSHKLGDILMGFAVLMTGISAMSNSVKFLQTNEAFISLLTSFSNPLLGILAGLLITCILQSASATVGILQALSVTGAISFRVAFPVIMGIAIGAAVPVLLSALGASINGKRTAFSYLIADVLGAVICSAIFYTADAIFHFTFLDMTMNMVSIALLNTLFRLATVILLAPMIGLLSKLVCLMFKPSQEDLEETAEIDHLDDRFIAHPALAIEQSNNAVCAMARKARKNLSRAFELVNSYTDDRYERVMEKEDVIDRYEDKLGTYLVKLTAGELSPQQSQQVSKFLHTISDFERIGDHAVNLANTAHEIHDKKLVFSPEAQKELDVLESAVAEIVILSTECFQNDDREMAMRVEPLEEVIDSLCDIIKIHHVNRVRNGECTLDHGFVFNDMLTDFERIADHCSNVAVAVIELDQNSFDTHEYLNTLKTSRSEIFNGYYDEYNQRFSLPQ